MPDQPTLYQGHGRIAHPGPTAVELWHSYHCGHCDTEVSGMVVARHDPPGSGPLRWLQCTACGLPSAALPDGLVVPGAKFGPRVDNLPAPIDAAYDEVRRCMSVGAYAAAELLCRNLLMHVAADKGAPEGRTFAGYVDYLAAEGYVTPPMKRWVDVIREHGNVAAHRLEPSERDRAEGTTWFTAMLLVMTYEADARASRYARPLPDQADQDA